MPNATSNTTTTATAPSALAAPSTRRVAATWLLLAQAAFQVLVAVLVRLDRDDFVRQMTGSALAPNHRAAVSSYHGTLGVHLVLAVLFAVGAVRIRGWRVSTRVRLSVPLTLTTVGGIAAMWLPMPTWLSPIGVALALAALMVLWWPSRRVR